MVALKHGIDIVAIREIAKLLEDSDGHFLSRCFRPSECRTEGLPARLAEYYAGRFAAKEATLKALEKGFGNGLAFTDIEIVASLSGQPTITLHGTAAKLAKTQGVVEWTLSISHTEDHAIASVIGLVR